MKKYDFWNGAVGICYICIFIGILLFIAYLLFGPGIHVSFPVPYEPVATTTTQVLESAPGTLFTCEQGRLLKAEFSQSSVHLSLSDGRRLTLPQTISGSGARYANPNETFVFWNKGTTAFIQENGAMTYQNCATK